MTPLDKYLKMAALTCWNNYDRCLRFEASCSDKQGKAIYRGGAILWKIKALIAEQNTTVYINSSI